MCLIKWQANLKKSSPLELEHLIILRIKEERNLSIRLPCEPAQLSQKIMSNSYSCPVLLNINFKGEHFAKLSWQEVRGTDTKESDFFMFLRDNNREIVQVKNCGRTLAMRATHASDRHIQRCSCGSHVVLEYCFSLKCHEVRVTISLSTYFPKSSTSGLLVYADYIQQHNLKI